MRYEFEELPYLYRGKRIADLMGEAEIDIGEPDSDPHVDSITLWYPLRGGKTEQVKITFAQDEKFWRYLEREILARAASVLEIARDEAFADVAEEPYDRLLPQEMR